MKIRSDFVTNSSSSSFVIAIKDDCSFEHVVEVFGQFSEEISEQIKEDLEYDRDIEEVTPELVSFELWKSFDKLANYLFELSRHGVRIGDWWVTATEGSSEADPPYRYLYNMNIEDSLIKVKSTEYC